MGQRGAESWPKPSLECLRTAQDVLGFDADPRMAQLLAIHIANGSKMQFLEAIREIDTASLEATACKRPATELAISTGVIAPQEATDYPSTEEILALGGLTRTGRDVL